MRDLYDPLVTYGYSAREAAWLRLVMIHSGVFLRRQYRLFAACRARGAADQRLVARLLHQQHAVLLHYHHRERLLHVRARPLYAAIGHAHTRHRRALPPVTMAHRLLMLDFLLQEPRAYIERTDDLVQVCLDRFGVPRTALPQHVFSSATDPQQVTIRYFVDRYLTAIEGDAVSFVVPDLTPRTAFAFTQFLATHAALIRALPRVDIVYLTAVGESASVAERRFHDAFGHGPGTPTGADLDLMHACFTARHAIESRTDTRLPSDVRQQYRLHGARFAGAAYASWYRAWLTGGIAALNELALRTPTVASHVRFRHRATAWRYFCSGRPTQFSRAASDASSRARRTNGQHI